MLATLDPSEQDQMRRLLTACIAALTEPPASATAIRTEPASGAASPDSRPPEGVPAG